MDGLDQFGELASTARFPLRMHGAFVCQVVIKDSKSAYFCQLYHQLKWPEER